MKRLFFISFVLMLNPGASIVPNQVVADIHQNDYKKIDVTDVPADVLKAISDKYSGYSVSESYISEKGEYKLILGKGEKSLMVHYTDTGEFIKEEVK